MGDREKASEQMASRKIDAGADIYRQIFKYSIVPTVIHDLEMNIIEVNDSAIELFGYSNDEFLTKSIFDLHTITELDHSREVREKMHHAKMMSIRTSFKRKDGTAFYAEATPTRFVIGGKPVIHVFIQDVTDQVEREMRDRAYMEELEQFAYITSHDLREPLRTISSYIELLADDCGDQLGEAGTQYLDIISAAANRMRELIRSLLEYNRSGRPEPLSEVDSKRLVDEVLSDLAGLIEEKGASIEIGEMTPGVGYEAKLRVLLQNLVVNALKFSRPDVAPRIKIQMTDNRDQWVLSVDDNGIGIEPAAQDKIFKVFQRLHPSAAHEGTGIGLATCRRIARIHGGEITVDSTTGKGSTFRVTISKQPGEQ